jgi:phage shock protein A
MREEEISDLRTQKDQLLTKIATLEKQISEFRSKIANHDE